MKKMARKKMTKEAIQEIIENMTLEEKAGMCSGEDFWHTKAVERLGIPAMMVSDGPNGLRKQDLNAEQVGINESIQAVSFPAGCATASSFDRSLLNRLGEALGEECQAENIGVVLGPAANIKRSPLCGRNFEYFSEDPYLATEIAAAQIHGIQSKNVGSSLKHYLANNQETRRMTVSSEIDERTLREIYLAAFEGAVKKEKPWTVMCSYNQINGVFASENPTYLTEVLRGEWGFDGFVVSDWGAVNDRIASIKAGLDLEMPTSNGINDARIVKAVKTGILEETILNQAVERILNLVFRYQENRDEKAIFDLNQHHKLAARIEEESAVLLKNENILPLQENEDIVFIGKYAEKPRYQGGGSAHINSYKVTSALESVRDMNNIIYCKGFDDQEDIVDEALLKEAIEAARTSKVAVVFAGLPDSFESEGFDRSHMKMPNCQTVLIEEVAKVQPNIVVVLHNGSPVEMPWIHHVKAVLEMYLGGQAVGEATCNLLFGRANPSGKLAETFPFKLEDNPSYLFYPGEKDIVEYREGIFVGYRYYDQKNMEVLFPFGHGLSYTTFAYSNLKLSNDSIKDTDALTLSVDITNTGTMAGKEVVQLYVADKESKVIRPIKELKGFEKIALLPNETKKVTFTLDKRAFAYFDTRIHDWHVETGEFELMLGKSSREIVLTKMIYVESSVILPIIYTLNSTIGDVQKDPKAYKCLAPVIDSYMEYVKTSNVDTEVTKAAISDEMLEANMEYMPLRAILSFSDGLFSLEDIQAHIDQANHA